MINVAIILLCTVAAAWALLFLPVFAKTRWPALIFLGSYSGTTAIGAAAFLESWGIRQLHAFAPEAQPLDDAVFGSPLYWFLLVVPFAIVPVAVLAGEKMIGTVLLGRRAVNAMPISMLTLYMVLFVFGTFCVYKLFRASALWPAGFDGSACYRDQILRRVELMPILGTPFYGLTYSSIPIVAVCFLTKYLKKGERLALLGFAICVVLLVWFNATIVMKAPLLVFIGMMGLTMILSGKRIATAIAGTAIVGVGVLALLTMLQFCKSDKISEREVPSVSEFLTRLVILRMAAGFPYYVETFSKPSQRCGIERPPRWFLTERACVPATEVFRRLYPNTQYVVGAQPAPVQVAGLAEAGPLYAILALVIGSCIIGGLCEIAGPDPKPASVCLKLIACVFAYYMTQASLTGALVDSYGLVWLLLPLAIVMLLHLCLPWSRGMKEGGRDDNG